MKRTRGKSNYRIFMTFLAAVSILCLLPVTALSQDLHVYEIEEISFTASNTCENPYLDVDLWVDLKGPDNLKYRIPAFWDGGSTWRVRMAATAPGVWQWNTGTETGDAGLDNKSGDFTAIAWSQAELAENPNRRGYIRVHEDGHTLEYADGTPFFYTGDTWYSAFTAIYSWGSDTGLARMSFQEAVAIRKSHGYNGTSIITCFPTDLTDPIWHSSTHGKKIAEDGSTPFEVNTGQYPQ